MNKTMSATSGAGTAYPSGIPDLLGFDWFNFYFSA